MSESELPAADRFDLQQLVGLYSHLVDDKDWDGLDAVFVEESIFDLSSGGTGMPKLEGLDALRRFFQDLQHPVAHHTTNLLIDRPQSDGAILLRSKALVVYEDGRVGSAEYRDRAVRTRRGWRIHTRTVLNMRPLPPSG